MVLLSFPAANRDPAVFPDADRVVIDRKENRHAAFGLGIHRCIGSNLARMEITVALQEWFERIPEFTLDPAATVTWSEGTVRGPRKVPVLFGLTSWRALRRLPAAARGAYLSRVHGKPAMPEATLDTPQSCVAPVPAGRGGRRHADRRHARALGALRHRGVLRDDRGRHRGVFLGA